MRKARLGTLLLLVGGLVTASPSHSEVGAESPGTAPRSETLLYRWSLEGVSGALARPVEMLYRQSLGRLRLTLVDIEPER